MGSAIIETLAAAVGAVKARTDEATRIGRLRRNYLLLDPGEGGAGLLCTLELVLDPTGIVNPGVLISDA